MKSQYKGKKKRKKDTMAGRVSQAALWVLDALVSVYMALILLVMPFYNKEGFVHIGTDKSTFFSSCSARTAQFLIPVLLVFLAAAFVSGIQKKNLRQTLRGLRLSPTDVFVLLYGASVLAAYAFSRYKEAVWRGEEGWFMGTVTQLTFVAAYFLVSRAWVRKNWLIVLMLPVSGLVFFLGLLNRFGIFPVDMGSTNVQFISTIGNINWYCGYMMSVFFGGFALLWQSAGMKLWQRRLLVAYVAVGFASLVTQGSSSGVLTMGIILLAAFCLSDRSGRRMRDFWLNVFLFSAVCLAVRLVRLFGWGELTYLESTTELLTNTWIPAIMTFLSGIILAWLFTEDRKGKYPERFFHVLVVTAAVSAGVLFTLYAGMLAVNTLTKGWITKMTNVSIGRFLTFSPTWGSNRGATWSAGWLCFWEQDILHKLVGVGPDGMASYLYNDGSAGVMELVTERFGAVRLTNAHNEWLTVLVNTGVFGLVSYGGIMISSVRRLLRSRGRQIFAVACGFCLLAYTVNNVFSFQQAMSTSTIFILLGVGENYLRGGRSGTQDTCE